MTVQLTKEECMGIAIGIASPAALSVSLSPLFLVDCGFRALYWVIGYSSSK